MYIYTSIADNRVIHKVTCLVRIYRYMYNNTHYPVKMVITHIYTVGILYFINSH